MNYENKPSGYYDNVRYEMLKYLPSTAKKILEVGCGNGCFAEVMKKQNSAEVWGIELMENEAAVAAETLDKVYAGEVEKFIGELPENYFDAIYFNDVIEHLYNPYQVIEQLKSKLTANGVIISSIPNIRYHSAFRMFLFNKDWKYDEYGIMDFTHIRFFTKKSIVRMYEAAGFDIVKHEGINKSRSLKPILYNILFLGTQLDIFNAQYATVARKK